MSRQPYVGTVSGTHGAYDVRDTPAGVLIGSVANAAWRSWVAWCAHGCKGRVADGSTRIAAARHLLRHFREEHV